MIKLSQTEKALKDIESFEDVINSVACKNIPVRTVCRIAMRSIKAWNNVLHEMNDVIGALPDEPEDSYNYGYRQSCVKFRELIMSQIGMVRR